MIKTDFINLYEELSQLNEAKYQSTPKLEIVSVDESVQESDDHDPKRHILRAEFYDPQEPTIMPRISMEFEFVRDLDSKDPDARKVNPHYKKWFEYNYRAYDYEGNLLPEINPDDERTETEMKILSNVHNQLVDDGIIDDDAIVVEQIPKHTIDILKEGSVITKSVKKEDICTIKFVENAPRSVRYFKFLSGLLENPVGQIKVHFAVPGMHIVIFEGDNKLAKGLIPENNPVEKVIRGQIGITNMASKSAGLIGIRFEDNSEFGPTAESFEATNIIGDITSDYDRIENLKEGVVVYVTESNNESCFG
jgi:hypothetical protein